MWINGGYINSHWEVAVKSSMVPSITMAEDRPLPQQFGSSFRNYDAIYGVGDSLIRQFVTTGPLGNPILRRSNFYMERDAMALNMKTLSDRMSFIDQVLQEHPELKNGNCAFLLGGGMWDLAFSVQSIDSHIEAIEKYIEHVHNKAPSAHIYWKSMTSVHVSVFDEDEIKDDLARVDGARIRLKYCSRSRAKALYEAQSELLQRMKIPVLDMYNMTFEAEEWHNQDDALHYDRKINDFFMDYFYSPDSSVKKISLSSPYRKP